MKRILLACSNTRQREAIHNALMLPGINAEVTTVAYEDEILTFVNCCKPKIVILHGTLLLSVADRKLQDELEYEGAAVYGIIRALRSLRANNFKGPIYLIGTGHDKVDSLIQWYKEIQWNTMAIQHKDFNLQLRELTWRFKRRK